MPKFYVKWKLNPFLIPTDPEERGKLWLSLLEMVEADMKTGKLKDWGNCGDGTGGYAIREEATQADLFSALLKWMPYVKFDVKPVMTLYQTIDSIKKVAASAKA